MENTKVAKLKMPTLITRKVWIGYYFNHYNVIVIYKEKPVIGTSEEGVYDTFDNRDKIAGCLLMDEFTELFPDLDISPIQDKKTGNVRDMQTMVLIEAFISAPFDAKGCLVSVICTWTAINKFDLVNPKQNETFI